MDQQSTSLRNKTLSGVRWSAIARIVQQCLSFVTVVILAHLLSPTAFGLIGMVLVVTNFVDIFKDLGTSTVIVQRKEVSQELMSSVFWTNLLFGICFTLVIVILAPIIGLFFCEPGITPIMRIMSISFIFSGLSVVPQALLIRKMNFRRLVFIENVSFLVGAGFGVGMALSGWGVWSLVMQSLLRVVSMAIFLWLLNPMVPHGKLSGNSLKSIASYSLNLSGFNLLNYFIRNADNMLIGRYLGSTSLGFYSLAYKWMLLPIYYISGIVGNVFFSTFSKIQDDNPTFSRVYLRLCASIGLVTFPLFLGMMALAKPLVFVALGPQWDVVVPLLMILSWVGLFQSIGTTIGSIYLAKGRTDLMLKWGLMACACYLVSFVIGLRWGVLGVALCYSVCALILFYPSLIIPFHLIGLRFTEFGRAMIPVFSIGVSMLALIKIGLLGLERMGFTAPWIQLAVGVLLGGSSYLIFVLKFQRNVLNEFLALLPTGRFWNPASKWEANRPGPSVS